MHFIGQNTAHFGLLADLSASMRARKVPCVSPETGYFLYLAMRAIRPQRILEIGTATGVSTLYLAAGMHETAHITTLERNARDAGEASRLFEEYGVAKRITQHEGDAIELLQSGSIQGPFDLVFVDAMKKQYGDYLRLVRPMLSEGAVVFCDDVVLFRHKMDDLYTLMKEWKMEGTIFPTDPDDGIMMLVFPKSC